MEKFGIFELLDTLSALTAPVNGAEAETGDENPAPETAKANPQDDAFAPPVFGAPPLKEEAPAQKNGDAISALLQRHERISKKIDGQK